MVESIASGVVDVRVENTCVDENQRNGYCEHSLVMGVGVQPPRAQAQM